MSYLDPSPEDLVEIRMAHHQRMWPTWKWLIILTIVSILFYNSLPERVPFRNPKIAAEPYAWPKGCEKRKYKGYNSKNGFDTISKNCLPLKYYIGDGQIWGWRRSTKWPYYFRVGNDAIMITGAYSGIAWSEENSVYEVIDDVFIVDKKLR